MADPHQDRNRIGARSTDPVTLSVVIPICDEEAVIETLHSRLLQVLLPLAEPFEVIFVNDGSRDTSPRLLDSICSSDARFKALHFSRNFGHQAAVTAGLRAAAGKCAVVMDGDPFAGFVRGSVSDRRRLCSSGRTAMQVRRSIHFAE